MKKGDFQSKGMTVNADIIEEELNVPPNLAEYNDVVQPGTARLVLLEVGDFSWLSLMRGAIGRGRSCPSSVYLQHPSKCISCTTGNISS